MSNEVFDEELIWHEGEADGFHIVDLENDPFEGAGAL